MQHDWKQAPWFIFDTETTGTDTSEDRIVQLGAVVMHCGKLVDRRLMLLDPGVPIPQEASDIHGISDADVAGKPSFADVFPALLEHIRSAEVLVSYNGSRFDWPLLEEETKRLDRLDHANRSRVEHGDGVGYHEQRLRNALDDKFFVDVLVQVRRRSVGRFWKGRGRHKLVAVAKRLGIELPPGMRAHRADADCYLTGRILWETRQWLPDEASECHALLEKRAVEQEADFQAWLAKQPSREAV